MKVVLSIMLVCTTMHQAFAQGCSDAGFCTIGSIKTAPADSGKDNKHKLSLLVTNGIGDQGVFVITPGIQYELSLNKKFAFQSKLNGNYANGNLGTAAGLGDLFLSSTYLIPAKKKIEHSFTAGTKIPLNGGDIQYANKPLPMQYQSSLGTFDIILGYKLRVKKFSANFAWQQPLTGSNRNSFLPQYLATAAAYDYAPSNAFKRKADVLLRLAYQISNKENWKWNASVLSIYHLGEDTYVDSKLSNAPIKIIGSKGLTVNITSMISYKLNKSFTIALTGGMPVVVRKVRPDGLTRAFALTPEINFHF